MDIILFLGGLLLGIVIGYIVFYLLNKTKNISRTDYDNISLKLNSAITEVSVYKDRLVTVQSQNQSLSDKLNAKEAEASTLQSSNAILQTQLANIGTQLSELKATADTKDAAQAVQQNELNTHKQRIAELVVKNTYLEEKMSAQKEEMESLQRTAHFQFEKIANQIFEEKSNKFTETNKVNIETLLNPLKEDIGKFKTKVEETYNQESKERFSLERSVKELIEQTNKISDEANNLASALKGQTKKQGDWGEMILERILETSGLVKGREYFVQENIKNEDGSNLRPDILVKLPDNRNIIIDSKVSLIAYDQFNAAENKEEQKKYLGTHLRSLYGHIDNLSGKKYDDIENSLDFTMMFIPIEPAYLTAIQNDSDLWAYAYSKRILLISPTNLIACLKLISDLWNREKQSRNAQDIVRKGEQLYDKFVNFTNSLEEVGRHINKTQDIFNTAMSQFKTGRGNLVSQAIQLKSLGLKTSKEIPSGMLPIDIDETDTNTSPE